jgi:hypothetical protein
MSARSALQYLRGRLKSRYWWVIVPTGRGGDELMSDFVRSFYREGPGLDVLSFPFSALQAGVPGKLLVAFALKQQCHAADMAAWLISCGNPAAEAILVTQDVHFWCSAQDSSLSFLISELLDRTLLRPNRWLKRFPLK